MKALVAMSGGVDSSVAAALMVEQGHDVIGVTLKQWEGPDGEMPTAGCCTVGDAEDPGRVSAQLDMPYYVLDHVDEFREAVVEPFGAEYLAGRTPNPCVECNRRVRFRVMLERTRALGCEVLATGHHAQVERHRGRYRLLAAADTAKDQSYVLHMLGQDELARVRFPVGGMTKTEVRAHAARLGLRTAAKPDSQDICFVGRGDYRDFLRSHVPDAARPGPIQDLAGSVVGSHDGVAAFTVGQRRGLGVAFGEPRYVVGMDPATATVTIGTRGDLLVGGCRVAGMTFVAGHPPAGDAVAVKIRYRATPVPARLRPDGSEWEITFDEPLAAVAPGQAAVLYDGDEVLGGGTIVTAVPR